MAIRRAKIQDVKTIQKLINESAKKNQVIPRSLNDIYENLRDFIVFEERKHIKGVCALHIVWEDLAEIRSLAVKKQYRGKGIGRSLVKKALSDARDLGVERVFALTYQPEYFKTFGFEDIDKAKLPHKIWGDCIRCPKFPECEESAVIISLTEK